jgi:branched-chain amino acid transport system ATP-binding protein
VSTFRPSTGVRTTRSSPPPTPAADPSGHSTTVPLLQLSGVSVRYGQAIALDAVNLEVRRGEIVSLLGGNASGKSTTMKTILGLVRPVTGTVWLAGADISRLPTPQRIRRGLGSVPEARRVFGGMTVEENLRIGAYTVSDRRAVASDLDTMFEMFPRLHQRRRQHAGTLSGGEQQMLAVARALMSHPQLLCLDEPTMGLSPLLVDQVLEQIARLNAELGLSVLVVEQQAELALAIAHRGYVLRTGQIVLSGTAAELLGNPLVQEAYLGRAA